MTTKQNKPEGERINRYLARSGLCSRREADQRIMDGRIAINGETIEKPGVRVLKKDIVTADGKVVAPHDNDIYLLYNKPRGLLCSRKDAKGRPLIYEHLDIPSHVQSIGRLDMDSEGLLLLTSDGNLAQLLTHPSHQIPRQYKVRIAGIPSLETLEKLRNGHIDIGRDERSDPWQITVDAESKGHSWMSVTIHRGRWREVRRTLEAVGHPVRRLMRIRFGPIRLEEGMPLGSWRNLTAKEVKKLQRL